jgi:hypothetical protein
LIAYRTSLPGKRRLRKRLSASPLAIAKIQHIDLYVFIDTLVLLIAACRRYAGLPLPKVTHLLYGAAQITRQ